MVLAGCATTTATPGEGEGQPPPADVEADKTAEAPPPASGDRLEIYLAAGVPSGQDSCHFTKESMSSAACELYRIGWDRERHQLVDQRKFVGDGVVAFQSAVSPDGQWLAYTKRDAKGKATVHVKSTSSTNPSDAGTPIFNKEMAAYPPALWTFPHWLGDDALLLSHPSMGAQCTNSQGQCVNVQRWSSTFRVDVEQGRPTGLSEILGWGDTAMMSIQDTWVNPVDRRLVAGHGRFSRTAKALPTCKDSCDDVFMTPYPFVVDVTTGERWIYQLRTTEPEFAKGGAMNLDGCAHLAWSPDGKRLLCTEQSTMPIYRAGQSGKLYAFDFDRSDPTGTLVTKDVGLMFAHAQPQDLVAGLGPNERCQPFYHKYAEFCGSNDLVVASTVCAVGAGDIRQSHAYLIDISEPSAPKYHDITAALEGALGHPAGTMRSFMATCAATPNPSAAPPTKGGTGGRSITRQPGATGKAGKMGKAGKAGPRGKMPGGMGTPQRGTPPTAEQIQRMKAKQKR